MKNIIICLTALILSMVTAPLYIPAEMVIIDFDRLPDGTPINNGTCVTELYQELGVKLSCDGLYPDFHKDYCAYAYSNSHAISGNNIMGGNIIGSSYQFLNFSMCYGIAEFATPAVYVSLYGVGDPFIVFAYDEEDQLIDSFSSTTPFLEIDAIDNPIKKITFGSWTGPYYTFFDQLTFDNTVSFYCDNDGDTYRDACVDGTCTGAGCQPAGCQTAPGDDCNDTDAAVHPGATEICDNKNNDCNAGTPDGSGEPWYGTACDGPDTDLCKEGTHGCTGGVQSCSDTTGNTAEVCTGGLDEDCDMKTDCADTDCTGNPACTAESVVTMNMVWTSDPADRSNTPKAEFKPGDRIRYHLTFTIEGEESLYYLRAVGKANNTSGEYWLTSFARAQNLFPGTYHWWWDRFIPEDASSSSTAKVVIMIRMFDGPQGNPSDGEHRTIEFYIL